MGQIYKKALLLTLGVMGPVTLSQAMEEGASTVCIYGGEGGQDLRPLKDTLTTLLPPPSYEMCELTPSQIKKGEWLKRAALFVMPGGKASVFLKELSPEGNTQIENYVREGGKYLGICAGAYYAVDQVHFAEGTDWEIKGERPLKFFPGVGKGPTLAPYDPYSYDSMQAASIREGKKRDPIYLFYNGGGHFVKAHTYEDVEVLATYEAYPKKAAIIQVQVGQGRAILSGPHWEWGSKSLDFTPPHPHLEALLNILKADRNEERRLELARSLLERLGLATTSADKK
jgi:biotin--protein ligase